MKFLVLGIAGFTIEHLTTPVCTDTVEQANKSLARTETAIKDASTNASETSDAIAKTLDTPASLPAELQEFTRSTQTLITLRDTLHQDIAAYETAYNNRLAGFDEELSQITDAETARSMTVLRPAHRRGQEQPRTTSWHGCINQTLIE